MATQPTPVEPATLDIRRVAGRIGAEIGGVRLSGDLDPPTVAGIRAALLAHKVIFFREQHHMTLADQEAFAALFGPIVPHPTIQPIEGTETTLKIAYQNGDTAANKWHSDESFMDTIPLGAVLRAVELPSVGGDTLWANCVTAYGDLAPPLRGLADQLWALHTNLSSYNAERRHPGKETTAFETEQPLVRIHPETGEHALLLGFHAKSILGLDRSDSARLMDLFQEHITRPENTVRWHWALGDVAFWDNRATQHYGIGDFTEPRSLNRISIDGDVPLSTDGRRSVVRRRERWIRD